MKVGFFVEFPEDDLKGLKYVYWPVTLYIAASSYHEFLLLKKKFVSSNVKEYVYWPVLSMKEGYWLSPFSSRKALMRVLSEVWRRPVSVMIDAELPTTRNPWLYLLQVGNFFRNRKLLRRFAKHHKEVSSAEYYPQGKWKEKFMSFLGLHYNPKKFGIKVLKMVYHSVHNFDEDYIRSKMKEGVKLYGANYGVGYGTISKGVAGNEPILSSVQLEKDLEIAKDCGINEVVVFRLGGLNREYSKVIGKFV